MELTPQLSAALAHALMPQAPAPQDPAPDQSSEPPSVLPKAIARYRAEREQEEREQAELVAALDRLGVTMEEVILAREIRQSLEAAMLAGASEVPQDVTEVDHGDAD